MTQRNPLNDRNIRKDEEGEGRSRKSAASAKPKNKAASSVTIKNAPKSKKEREKQKQQKAKEDRKLTDERLAELGPIVNPRYKTLKKVWIVLLVVALVSTISAWVLGHYLPDMNKVINYTILGVAYLTIILALVIDFKFLRPVRNAQKEQAARPTSKGALKRYEQETKELNEAKYADQQAKKAERAARRASLNPFRKHDEETVSPDDQEADADGVAKTVGDASDGQSSQAAHPIKKRPAREAPQGAKVQIRGAKTITIIDDDKKNR